MSADVLLAKLKAAGLHVVEEPGWRTRGNRWNVDGKPEGIMQHHTAPPNPYPIKALYPTKRLQWRVKCNVATHPDGTLYLVAYKACNYSSGPGMAAVLKDNVRESIAPTHNATRRGLKGGNRHFWNYENSHPGDGSRLPTAQFDTIVESTRITQDHFELNAHQVISHAEWTRRKIDPNWNGSNRMAINQIREAAMFTIHEIEELKRIVVSLDSVNSNGGFAGYAAMLVRKERTYPLENMVTKTTAERR